MSAAFDRLCAQLLPKHASNFRKNCDFLARARPELWQELEPSYNKFLESPLQLDGHPIELIEPLSAAPNFSFWNSTKSETQRYYSESPEQDGIDVLKKAQHESAQILVVLGAGLGHLTKLVELNRTPRNYCIVVIERRPENFFLSLFFHDFTKMIANPSVQWVIGKSPDQANYFMVKVFEAYTTTNRYIKILANATSLIWDEKYFECICEYITFARDQSTLWSGNSVEDSFRGLQNICQNLPILLRNPGIAILNNKFKGKTCISVAAGPGANEAWELLRDVQGRIPIIACDTMLKPMNEHGIVPDLVTALERDPIVADMFRGQPIHERTTLVGPGLLIPDAIECFRGRKLFYSAGVGYSDYFGLNALGQLNSGSSAGNLNLGVATYLGFSKVIMIGHNLAFGFNSHESHVKGTIDPSREALHQEEEIRKKATGGKVPTADGLDEVYTIFEYNLFRAQIENHIAVSVETEFINVTAKGAKINGSRYVSIDEIERQIRDDDSVDFYSILQEELAATNPNEAQARHQATLARLQQSVEEGQKILLKSREMIDAIKTWKREIAEAESGNTPWSIDKLDQCIAQILDLKVSSVNRNPAFQQALLSVMSPVHVAFEREINEYILTYKDNYQLKRDFLIRHSVCFSLWNHWLPQIIACHKEALSKLSAMDCIGPVPNPRSLTSHNDSLC